MALLAALVGSTVPAAADDLIWEVVEGWSVEQLEPAVDRLASEGYTVQAVVLEAEQPTVLMAREGRRAQPRVAHYRLLGRGQAATVDGLGAEGWSLHRSGLTRNRTALLVLRRPASGQASASGLRTVEVSGPVDNASAALAAPYGEGLVALAALGGPSGGSDWLLLGPPPVTTSPASAGKPGEPREVRVVSDVGSAPLATKLATLAADGFAVDTLWSRPGARFSLGGTKEVVAVVSRPHGVTRPVAHTRLEIGDEPSATGTLLAAATYGNKLVFAIRDARSSDYDADELILPTPTDQQPQSAWERATLLRERLHRQVWSPIELAWMTWDAGRPSSMVVVEREAPSRFGARSSAAEADRGAPPIPSGATTLPADGGEPAASWRTILDATRRNDLKAAKARWTGAKLAAWNENVARFKAPFGLGFSEKDLFESEVDDVPTDPQVIGGWLQGDEALLRVEATANGERAVSDLTFRREGGVWKLADQSSWQPLP